MNVAITVPVTSSTCPPKLLEAPLTARFSDIVCKVGAICHRPNSAEVIRLARHGPQAGVRGAALLAGQDLEREGLPLQAETKES